MTRWHPSDRPGFRKRLQRRAFPITAYVGPNGHGKSLAMVYDTIPSLDHGRPVLSTVRLLDFRNPRPCQGGVVCDDPANHYVKRRTVELVEVEGGGVKDDFREYVTEEPHAAAHPYYVPFRTYEQLLGWRSGDVLMDEVTGVASSRESGSMPVQVANHLMQLRRNDVSLRWTAPTWARADKVIREVTQAVTVCIASFPKARPTPRGAAPRLWSDRRLFTWRTYDAALMEDFESQKADHIVADITQRVWRPGALTNLAYDTLDPVQALGWANDAGLCMSCGGKRSHRKCSCPPDHDHETAGGGSPQGGALAVVPASAAALGVASPVSA